MAIRKTPRSGSAINTSCPIIVEFLLDETGSMSSWKSATIQGFNHFLTEQRNQPGQALLTLSKFDTSGIKTPYTDIDVKMVPDMNQNTFIPGGGTNLRDCLGSRIRQTKERIANFTQAPNVLIVVMTDGEDNASRLYSEGQIREMIVEHERLGWTFVYMGATQNALQIAQRLGFRPGNTKQFEGSQMSQTMSDLSNSTVAYRSRNVASATTETNYFAK